MQLQLMKQEVMDFTETRERYAGGFGGRKKGRNVTIKISKINNFIRPETQIRTHVFFFKANPLQLSFSSSS